METLSYKVADFEGPLDLLLTLISKNKLNIYDINISELLDQYMSQIKAFKDQNMDVASEFMEMAARLVYIKSAMLLPKHDEGENLRQELTGELLEYQVCKQMAKLLSERTEGFSRFVRKPMKIQADKSYRRIHQSDELVAAYMNAVGRGMRHMPPPPDDFTPLVAKKIVSVASRVVHVLRSLRKNTVVKFNSLFDRAESRSELVATFLAVLELVKARRITVNGEHDEMSVKIYKEDKTNE